MSITPIPLSQMRSFLHFCYSFPAVPWTLFRKVSEKRRAYLALTGLIRSISIDHRFFSRGSPVLFRKPPPKTQNPPPPPKHQHKTPPPPFPHHPHPTHLVLGRTGGRRSGPPPLCLPFRPAFAPDVFFEADPPFVALPLCVPFFSDLKAWFSQNSFRPLWLVNFRGSCPCFLLTHFGGGFFFWWGGGGEPPPPPFWFLVFFVLHIRHVPRKCPESRVTRVSPLDNLELNDSERTPRGLSVSFCGIAPISTAFPASLPLLLAHRPGPLAQF